MGLQAVAYKEDKITKPLSGYFTMATKTVGYAVGGFLAELSDLGMAQIDPLSSRSLDRLDSYATRTSPAKEKKPEFKRLGFLGKKLRITTQSYDPSSNERSVCEATLTFDSKRDRNKAHRLLRQSTKQGWGGQAIYGSLHTMMRSRQMENGLITMDTSFADSAPQRKGPLASLFTRKSSLEKTLARMDRENRRWARRNGLG